MHRSIRRSGHSISTVAAVATALSLLVAVPAVSTAAGPDYRADITPATVAAGTDLDPTFVVTLTHLATTAREIGSVRIRPPAGISLTGATAKRGSNVLNVAVTAGSVTVSNLQLNDDHQTATVTLKVDIPCGDAFDERIWRVDAVKNQTFDDNATPLVMDGDNSHLRTQVDRCSLKFLTQPASAAVDTKITSVAANPDGAPIRVQLLDGAGRPASQAGIEVDLVIASGGNNADLGDFTASTNGNGVAEFGPKIGRPGPAYQLQASYSSSAIADSSPSAGFAITDVAVACSGTCAGKPTQEGDTTASVTAVSNGILSYSLGLDSIDCNNAVNHSYHSESEVLTFNVTAATGRTNVTITLKASSVDRIAKKYEVCFSSPESRFTNLYGVVIQQGEAGLLPACPKKVTASTDPCVLSKTRLRNGDIEVAFSVPGGDPRGKI